MGSLDKLNQLKRLYETPVLVSCWPQHQEYSLAHALCRASESSVALNYKNVLQVALAHGSVNQCPIIAVLGELNAGKSSVVAGFLGDTGRRRLPRGVAESKGTHRFVYWAPAKWMKSGARKDAFLSVLAAAHGDQREDLSLDPARAAEQYRSGRNSFETLQIPLVAYDSSLDQLGAAFLDCPDVQTADQDGSAISGANIRLEFLADAARLCSAFLLVWDRAKLREQLLIDVLESLRSRMPRARLYLLANKVRPKDGELAEVLSDIGGQRLVERFGLEAVYMAWDFDIETTQSRRGWRELTPPKLVQTWQRQDPLPKFFRLHAGNTHVPASTPSADFLVNLPRQLDAAELQTQTLLDHLAEAQRLVAAASEKLVHWVDQANARTREAHRGLLAFCVEQFTGPQGESLQFPFPGFAEALRESFAETAPWYVRPTLRLNERVKRLIGKTAQKLRQMVSLPWRQLSSKQFQETLRDMNIVGARKTDARGFAEMTKAYRWVDSEHGVDSLEQAWTRVLRDFAHFEIPLDKTRLNEVTKGVWRGLNTWQQVRASGAAIIGTLAAVTALGGGLIAVVDGGATYFVSISLAQSLSLALPGPAAAAAGAVGATVAVFNSQASSLARDFNSLPALSALFAFACDAFGLPRNVNDKDAKICVTLDRQQFPLPDLDVPQRAAVCQLGPTGDLGLWQIADGLQQYQRVFDG